MKKKQTKQKPPTRNRRRSDGRAEISRKFPTASASVTFDFHQNSDPNRTLSSCFFSSFFWNIETCFFIHSFIHSTTTAFQSAGVVYRAARCQSQARRRHVTGRRRPIGRLLSRFRVACGCCCCCCCLFFFSHSSLGCRCGFSYCFLFFNFFYYFFFVIEKGKGVGGGRGHSAESSAPLERRRSIGRLIAMAIAGEPHVVDRRCFVLFFFVVSWIESERWT